MSTLQQLRSHRIFGLAIFDIVSSIIGLVAIFLLSRYFYWTRKGVQLDWKPFVIAGILLAIPIGIFFHVIFGTNTSLNYKLGLSTSP